MKADTIVQNTRMTGREGLQLRRLNTPVTNTREKWLTIA
jgi:hypothetical protein